MSAAIDFSNNANRSLQLLVPSDGDILRYASGAWASGKVDLANFTSGIIATSLVDNSDLKLPTQKAVKTAVDALSASIVPYTPTAGMILQVVSATKVDAFTTTSATLVDITGLSVTITPSSVNNKILIFGHVSAAAASWDCRITLVRNTTPICVSTGGSVYNQTLAIDDVGGNTIGASGFVFLDSPNTVSQVTYKFQAGRMNSGNGTIFINRGQGNTESGASSTIAVMEVKG